MRTAVHVVTNALRRGLQAHAPLSDHILVGVSGGQDSLALASALSRLVASARLHCRISLVHCNHSWPGDDAAAAHVLSFAIRHRLDLTVVRGENVSQTEAGAREWRYSALSDIADSLGTSDILVAHTRTDLAETALLNITAGAGADGVGAMRSSRPLTERHRLLRPLLDVSRADTRAYCRELDLPVWDDPYNDADFARNRIRARVMPLLRDQLNPRVEHALARNALLLRDDADALELLAAAAFHTAVHFHSSVISVQRQVLRSLHVALQRRVFRRLLAVISKPGVHPSSFTHVDALCKLLFADSGTRAASLQGGAVAQVDINDCIVLSGGYVELYCRSHHANGDREEDPQLFDSESA